MDADCLIKLTKSDLKQLVCKNFSVFIPEIVKEEVVDNAEGYPDAEIIKENLEKKLLTIEKSPLSSKKGEDAVFTFFQKSKFDAVCSDDRRFIRRLRLFNIPYLTPSVFIVILLKNGRLKIKEARERLDSLSPFVSDDEYNAMKLILERWGIS